MCSKYKIVSQEKLSVNHFVHNPFLFIAHHPKWFIDTQITFHSSIFLLTLFYLYGYLCIFLHACQLQIHHSTLHKKVKQTHKHGKVVSIFQCNCRLLDRRRGGLWDTANYAVLPLSKKADTICHQYIVQYTKFTLYHLLVICEGFSIYWNEKILN